MNEAMHPLIGMAVGFLLVVAGSWVMARFQRAAKWFAISLMAAPAVPLALYGIMCRDPLKMFIIFVVVLVYTGLLVAFLRQNRQRLF